MRDDAASAGATEPNVGDRAEVGELLVSDNWLKRLDEARAQREKVLAAQALPPIVVQPLPMARRDTSIDRFPPLEPPETAALSQIATDVPKVAADADTPQPIITERTVRFRPMLFFASGIVTGVGLAVLALLLTSA